MSMTMLPPTRDLVEEQQNTLPDVETQAQICEQALQEHNLPKLYTCLKWLALQKKHQPATFALKKAEIKIALNGHTGFDMRDLVSAINAEVRNQERAEANAKLDIADVATEWARANRNKWAYSENTHTWYTWIGSHWQEQQEKCLLLDQEAIIALQDAGIAVNSNQSINCFARVAASSPYCKRNFAQEQPGKLNFANGTLDLATKQLSPFHPDDQFVYCLNYNYDAQGIHPTIDAYLETTIPDEHARQALIAHIGLSLMRDTTFHNFGLLIGPPRSGKSTLLALINALCGFSDMFEFAGPSLFSRDLEGKRSRARWVDRRVVCVDELPAEALREEELLKLMSAHSGVEMRRIGKDERLDNRWKPKLIMSTNDTPHYKDTAGAIKKRAIVIECPNARPDTQQDKRLLNDKLLPEIGAFAATCLAYAHVLIQRGYYPRSRSMQLLVDEIEHNGNPLKAFIREMCVLEPTAKVTSDVLHKTYAEYIVEGGNFSLAKNKMGTAIRDMHIGVTSAEWMRFNGRPSRALKGIRLRTDFDADPQEPSYQDDPLLMPPPITSPRLQVQESEETHPCIQQQQDTEEGEREILEYPEAMTVVMEPAPSEPCPTCHTKNYAPYWGEWATRTWGCATCYPEIPAQLGLYKPEYPKQ